MTRALLAGSWLALAFAALTSCGVEAPDLAKVWTCNPRSTVDQCGTSHGHALTCYSAEHLGGEAFCADTCDPNVGSPDPDHWTCLHSGALLQRCTPGTDSMHCPDGLNCYRTSLSPLENDGLCLKMPVCSSDADCANSGVRSSCVGPIVKSKYPSPDNILSTDSLHCVQGCAADSNGSCANGEICLSELLTDPSVPEICVPPCSDSDPCPVNFFCLRSVSPAAPPYCVPGFPTSRCLHDEDCVVGTCRDGGAGFKLCTIDCSPTSNFCSNLQTGRYPAYCAGSICVSRGPFAGLLCIDDSDCPSGAKCSTLNPYIPDELRGPPATECHKLCSGPGDCASPSVVPYLCLRVGGEYGECYPADFGLPCEPGVESCMGTLTCLSPGADGQDPPICTLPCKNDLSCAHDRLAQHGRCIDGFCRLLQKADPCTNHGQCASRVCGADGTCQ